MFLTIIKLFSLSILFAGIVAIVRFRKINKIYHPFLYLVWLACFNEILNLVFLANKLPVAVNNNIYVLLESLLILWFFKNMLFLNKKSSLFLAACIFLLALWTYENMLEGKIYSISSYFRICYSFIIVLLSITTINKLLSTVRRKISSNSVFLICTSFIIFFTFKILVETFWLYGVSLTRNFQVIIYNIIIYINLFTNLVFALAILWMPKKQIFTMPS